MTRRDAAQSVERSRSAACPISASSGTTPSGPFDCRPLPAPAKAASGRAVEAGRSAVRTRQAWRRADPAPRLPLEWRVWPSSEAGRDAPAGFCSSPFFFPIPLEGPEHGCRARQPNIATPCRSSSSRGTRCLKRRLSAGRPYPVRTRASLADGVAEATRVRWKCRPRCVPGDLKLEVYDTSLLTPSVGQPDEAHGMGLLFF